MGLRYLGGKSWAEVTREERFFCQHLYARMRDRGAKDFVDYLNERVGLGADADANWEIAYEVCFYRDLRHHQGGRGVRFSPKRTFDLCLLSDRHIVVLEAKAHEGFSTKQMAEFVRDRSWIAKATAETGVVDVSLLGLISSWYRPKDATQNAFAGILTWKDLVAHFGDNDPILLRADAIYQGRGGTC